MADPDIKIDHDGFTLLRPITAFCGTAPGTVTRRASVTADVFGDTYVAEFDVVPGETVTLPPPGPDETGVWRKVEGYEREAEPEDEPEKDDALSSLVLDGETPSAAARRIRTELSALRGALADVRQQLLLATEAASRARDGEEEAKRALLYLEQQVDSSTSGIDGVAEDTGSHTQRLVYVATLAYDGTRLAGELAALEWIISEKEWCARRDRLGRYVIAPSLDEAGSAWESWTEAAKAIGRKD